MIEILLKYLFVFIYYIVQFFSSSSYSCYSTQVCLLCFVPWPLGGAPNYYPNSFSAPETQPRCVESKFKVSPDVARYNTDDEDNVTQVETEEDLNTRLLTHFLTRI